MDLLLIRLRVIQTGIVTEYLKLGSSVAKEITRRVSEGPIVQLGRRDSRRNIQSTPQLLFVLFESGKELLAFCQCVLNT